MLTSELKTIFEKICATIPQRYTEYAELNEVNGAICAQDLFAPTDIPHADRSLRDGIAYNSHTANLTEPLKIMSELSASQIYSMQLTGNECVFLSTGSYLPLGADRIIPVEDIEITADGVTIKSSVNTRVFIEKRGAQLTKGMKVIAKNTPITHRHVEILATLRINSINIVRMPRIGILSTGSEITDQFGEKSFIVNSNYHALSAFLKSKGIPHGYFGVSDDIREEIGQNITKAMRAYDALITFGGTAKGQHDLMGSVVEDDLKGEILVSGLRATPGKTFRLAVLEGKPLFLLPGTPSASLLCEELFINAWIMAYKGFDWKQNIITCKSGFDFKKRPGFGRFVPCAVYMTDGELVAYPLQNISDNSSLRSSDRFNVIHGIAILDTEMEQLSTGERMPLFLTGSTL